MAVNSNASVPVTLCRITHKATGEKQTKALDNVRMRIGGAQYRGLKVPDKLLGPFERGEITIEAVTRALRESGRYEDRFEALQPLKGVPGFLVRPGIEGE